MDRLSKAKRADDVHAKAPESVIQVRNFWNPHWLS